MVDQGLRRFRDRKRTQHPEHRAPTESVDNSDRFVHLSAQSGWPRVAIRLLGDPELEDAYAAAWQEWVDSGDAQAWAATVSDGFD